MTIIEQLHEVVTAARAMNLGTVYELPEGTPDTMGVMMSQRELMRLVEALAALPPDWEQQLQALERTWSRRCANVIAKAVADVEAAESRVAVLTETLGEAEYFAKNIDLFIAAYDDSGLLEERRIKVLKIIRAALTPKAEA